MKVWFSTKPLAEFACRWAEPRVTRMAFVDLITVDKKAISREGKNKGISPPGDTTTFWTGISLSIR
jgi:hypothetical protein